MVLTPHRICHGRKHIQDRIDVGDYPYAKNNKVDQANTSNYCVCRRNMGR